MLVFIQLLTITGVFSVTYLFFQVLGPRRASLLMSADEKSRWDSEMSRPVGKWFTLTNVVGTLTSLATAYLFFIGNAKVFGLWILICVATIFIGSFVTNNITTTLLQLPSLSTLFNSNEQRAGVIATLFWKSGNSGRWTSRLVKWVSSANILSVIWLEFALFSDISRRLFGFGPEAILFFAFVVAGLSALIVDFTLRYGLRGFVFADAFHAPLIVLATLMLLLGAFALLANPEHTFAELPSEWHVPVLGMTDCIFFAMHVACLNLFLVLVTEPHWLRFWAFREREVTMQVKALAMTSLAWLILIVIGFCAYVLTGATGEEAIVGLLDRLSVMSPVFIVAFWMGGTAALFSTADTQIYAWLLVTDFDINSGTLRNRLMSDVKPGVSAILIGLVFGCCYFGVRYLDLPFEKLVFLIVPLPLNLLPAFVLLCSGKNISPWWIVVSITLYVVCAVFGLLQPQEQFVATLAAGLVPLAVGFVAWASRPLIHSAGVTS